MSFGNGLAQAFSYNPRLQPSEFKYTQSGQSNYLLDLQTFWGMNATQNESNNGNLQSVLEGTNNGPNLSVMINTYTGYNYDGVNRLIAANDNNWSRSFGYDPYGNMWVTGATGITPSSLTPTGSNGYNANNQLTVNAGYDASGNQTTFGVNTMTYDAESRQIGVSNTNPGMQATYSYDGDGKRVMRSINGASTTYVYDASGQLTAEYDATPPGVPLCATCYLSWDHLGSTRLVTDQSDNVVSRHDYLPFGEEILSGVGGRTSVWDASDLVTQKFTAKERDQESGLDYFGARYYGSALGRFTSPDWSATPEPVPYANFEDPQTLNGYAYVRNNPLSKPDPDGHCAEDFCIVEGAAVTTGALYGGAAIAGALGFTATAAVLHDKGDAIISGAKSLVNSVGSLITQATSSNQGQAPPAVHEVDAGQHPEAAQHVKDAQAVGKPDVLTVGDKSGTGARRREAMKGTATVQGKDRDEYPPAWSAEGGAGASVRPIDASDNRGAGAAMGNTIRDLPPGTKVQVKVKDPNNPNSQ